MRVYEIFLYRQGEYVGTNFKCPRCGKYLSLWGQSVVVCSSCSYILDVKRCLWRIGIRQPLLIYFLEDIISAYYQVIRRLIRDSKKRASLEESSNIQKRR